LITKENKDGSHPKGIYLSLGIVPHHFYDIAARYRIENTYECTYNTVLTDHADNNEKTRFFKEGNAPIVGRNKWGHFNLGEMAPWSRLEN